MHCGNNVSVVSVNRVHQVSPVPVSPPVPPTLPRQCCERFLNVTQRGRRVKAEAEELRERKNKSFLKSSDKVSVLLLLLLPLFCQRLSIQQKQPEARTSPHSLSASQGVLLHSLLFCLSSFSPSFFRLSFSASPGKNKLGKQEWAERSRRLCSESQTLRPRDSLLSRSSQSPL